VKEVSPQILIEAHNQVTEFDKWDTVSILKRCGTTGAVMIAAFCIDNTEEKIAGYMVGYDRYRDGSFYCWMTGD
jgi:hypothetical protein